MKIVILHKQASAHAQHCRILPAPKLAYMKFYKKSLILTLKAFLVGEIHNSHETLNMILHKSFENLAQCNTSGLLVIVGASFCEVGMAPHGIMSHL